MCGRFAFSTPFAVFVDTFDGYDFSVLSDVREAETDYGRPRFNIAPTQEVPVVPNDGSNRVQLFRWGLVPGWVQDPSIGNRMINARAETIAEKPSFRDAFRKRCCLMLSDGFYEWRTSPGTKTKTPIHIKLKTGRPFAFAGLWETWTPKPGKLPSKVGSAGAAASGKVRAQSGTTESPEAYGPDHPLRTCTMITTEANALMAQFHHRMPVILPREHQKLWLSPEAMDPGILIPLLVPYPTEEMVAYPVATTVNSPRNDSSDCIVQVALLSSNPASGFDPSPALSPANGSRAALSAPSLCAVPVPSVRMRRDEPFDRRPAPRAMKQKLSRVNDGDLEGVVTGFCHGPCATRARRTLSGLRYPGNTARCRRTR